MSDTAVYLAYTSSQEDVILRNIAAAVPTTAFLGGRLIGGPALAVAPAGVLGPDSTLVVFGRGTENALWWRHQTAAGWAPWRSLGGKLTSKPAATVEMTNELVRSTCSAGVRTDTCRTARGRRPAAEESGAAPLAARY